MRRVTARSRQQQILVVLRKAFRQPALIPTHVRQHHVRQLVRGRPVCIEVGRRPVRIDQQFDGFTAVANDATEIHGRVASPGAADHRKHDDACRRIRKATVRQRYVSGGFAHPVNGRRQLDLPRRAQQIDPDRLIGDLGSARLESAENRNRVAALRRCGQAVCLIRAYRLPRHRNAYVVGQLERDMNNVVAAQARPPHPECGRHNDIVRVQLCVAMVAARNARKVHRVPQARNSRRRRYQTAASVGHRLAVAALSCIAQKSRRAVRPRRNVGDGFGKGCTDVKTGQRRVHRHFVNVHIARRGRRGSTHRQSNTQEDVA